MQELREFTTIGYLRDVPNQQGFGVVAQLELLRHGSDTDRWLPVVHCSMVIEARGHQPDKIFLRTQGLLSLPDRGVASRRRVVRHIVR